MLTQSAPNLSENTKALWLKALSAFELRNYSYAISLLQAVLKEKPEFLDARKTLRKSQIALTKGKKSLFGGFSVQGLTGNQTLKKDPRAALEAAEKMLESDPFNAQGNHLLKEAAMALNDPATAAFALQTVVDGNPKDTKALHDLGDFHYSQGDAEKAIPIYNRILEINPSDLVATKRSKDAAAANTMKTGGWETAKDYRDLIKNKEEAISLEQKGRVVKSEEMIDQQLAELHQQAEAQPENLDVVRKIAALYEQREDLTNALAWYNYASDLSQGTDSWLLRKASDLQLKQLDLEIKEREDWLVAAGEEHEESPRIIGEVAEMKARKAQFLLDEAHKRVERNPTDLQFRFELGEQLMLSGQFTEAIPELQRARQNPNVRLRAMNLLGQCYVGKKMLDLAVKQFTDAASEILAMDATKKEILYKLGSLYEELGQKDKALDCFKQIYEVDYSYQDVATRVESSYSGN